MRYAKLYWEDVAAGGALPPLVKPPIQQIQLTRYAGASGDFNPIHQDDAFAKAAGMGGVFAHGMLSMGFAAQAVTDWAGVGRVRKISVRFAGLVRLGDVITCHGRVLEEAAGRWSGGGDPPRRSRSRSRDVGRERQGREGDHRTGDRDTAVTWVARCPARDPRRPAARGNRASPPPWREMPAPPTAPRRG